MKSKVSQILRYLLSAALAVVLLALAFRGVDWSAFVGGVRSCRWAFVLLSMCCGLCAFALRAVRWKLLLNPVDPSIGLPGIFNGVCIGNLANCALPGAGEFVRCGVITRRSALQKDGSRRASYDKVLGTVVLERMWDLLSIFAILVVLAVAKWSSFGGFLVEKVLAPAAGRLSVGLGVVVASLAVLAVAAVWAVFRWRNENRLCAKLFSVAKGLMDGLRSCLRMEGKGSFMLLTLLIWTMYWLNSVCILAALPQIGGLGLLDALFLMAAGSIASVVPVPGGFGAYHYLVALAMSTLYGLPWETGILFATLSHESQALTMVISGAASYVSESVASKKNN